MLKYLLCFLLLCFSSHAQDTWQDCPRCDASGSLQDCFACQRCQKDEASQGIIGCPVCKGAKIETCWTCFGKTYLLGTCRNCKGTGYIEEKRCSVCSGRRVEKLKCQTCEGRGKATCSNCDGVGKILCPICFGRKIRCVWIRCELCEGVGGWYGKQPPGK